MEDEYQYMGHNWPNSSREKQPIEENSIRDDDQVSELDKPDHRAQRKKPRDASPTQFGKDVERGPTRPQYLAVAANDMHCTLAGRGEFGGHWWIGNHLKGLGVEALSVIVPPDPGDQATSESAVAVPKNEVSIHRCRSVGLARHIASVGSNYVTTHVTVALTAMSSADVVATTTPGALSCRASGSAGTPSSQQTRPTVESV